MKSCNRRTLRAQEDVLNGNKTSISSSNLAQFPWLYHPLSLLPQWICERNKILRGGGGISGMHLGQMLRNGIAHYTQLTDGYHSDIQSLFHKSCPQISWICKWTTLDVLCTNACFIHNEAAQLPPRHTRAELVRESSSYDAMRWRRRREIGGN